MKIRAILSFLKIAVIFLTLKFIFIPQIIKADSNLILEDFNNFSNFQTNQDLKIEESKLKLNLFSESFSYPDGPPPNEWSVYSSDGKNNWQISNEVLKYTANDYNEARIIYNNLTLKNGEITVDLKTLGGEQLIGIIFRAENENNYYRVVLTSLYKSLEIDKIENGAKEVLASLSENYNINTWYKLKIIFFEKNIKVYVDDVLKLNVDDPTFLSANKIGFWRDGAGGEFDNLVVKSLSGQIESKTFSFSQNIQKVSLSLTGNYSTPLLFLVSNNNGGQFYRIKKNQFFLFPSSGKDFKYKIIFPKGTSENDYLENISFNITFGENSNTQFIYNQSVPIFQYSKEGISAYHGILNPNNLNLYQIINDSKFVQQGIFRKTPESNVIFYYIDASDSSNSKLKAYNLTQKKIEWEFPLQDFSEQTPAIFGDTIYVGSYAKKIFALNVNTGSKLWEFSTNDTISGSPIIESNDTIFLADYGYNNTTTLYAIDKNTRTLKWSFSQPYKLFMSFSLDEDLSLLYVVYADTIKALSINDGSEKWSNSLGIGYITKPPAIAGDKIVVGGDRGITVLNIADGSIIWKQLIGSQTEDGIGATPLVFKEIIYYPTKNDKKIYARSLKDGGLIWSTDVSSWSAVGTFSTPIITEDGYLYLAYNEKVIAINSTDGKIIKEFGPSAWNENNVSIGYGYLIYSNPNEGGKIYVYKTNEEEITVNDSITLDPGDRTITQIYLNNTPVHNFSCVNNSLIFTGIGSLKIKYNSDINLKSYNFGMIFNIDTDNKKISACYSGNGNFSYTLPTNLEFTEVLKNNEIFSRANWSLSKNIITISDHFSTNTYEFVKYSPSFSNFIYFFPLNTIKIQNSTWQPYFEFILPNSEFDLSHLEINFWQKNTDSINKIESVNLNPLKNYETEAFRLEILDKINKKIKVFSKLKEHEIKTGTYFVFIKIYDTHGYSYQSPNYEFTVQKDNNIQSVTNNIESSSSNKKKGEELTFLKKIEEVKKNIFNNKGFLNKNININKASKKIFFYCPILLILLFLIFFIKKRISFKHSAT